MKAKAATVGLPLATTDAIQGILGDERLPASPNPLKPAVSTALNTLVVKLREPYQFTYTDPMNDGTGTGDLMFGNSTAEIQFLPAQANAIPLDHGDSEAWLDFVPTKVGTHRVTVTYIKRSYVKRVQQGVDVTYTMEYTIKVEEPQEVGGQ